MTLCLRLNGWKYFCTLTYTMSINDQQNPNEKESPRRCRNIPNASSTNNIESRPTKHICNGTKWFLWRNCKEISIFWSFLIQAAIPFPENTLLREAISTHLLRFPRIFVRLFHRAAICCLPFRYGLNFFFFLALFIKSHSYEIKLQAMNSEHEAHKRRLIINWNPFSCAEQHFVSILSHFFLFLYRYIVYIYI